MTQNTKYTLLAVLVIVIIGLGYFYKSGNFPYSSVNNATTTEQVSTTTGNTQGNTSTNINNTSTTGFASYGNGEYGFSIKYPKYVQARSGFSTFHELGNNWRLYAGPANQGKALASFSIHSIDQGTISNGKQSYPLYFSAEVRIGVSPNVKECYTKDSGYTNQKVTDVVINGVTFKKFSTADGATMKYVQAESYRTIRNNQCFVLEQIKNGSVYRDEKMGVGITENTLTNYYNTGKTIIETFKFTK